MAADPRPVTTPDLLLAQVRDELRHLNRATTGRAACDPPEGGELVALREPDPPINTRARAVDRYATGGGWYRLPDGRKVQGRDAAAAALNGA